MNNEELQILTEDLSLRYFDKPFLHQALFNKRLRTIGGRYILSNHNIEINFLHYKEFGLDELVGIIKHELCHYHLHIEGKGYKHRDSDFKKLLVKVNAPRFCAAVTRKKKRISTKQYRFKCSECSLEYIRKRNMDINKYVCGKCRGKLIKITG